MYVRLDRYSKTYFEGAKKIAYYKKNGDIIVYYSNISASDRKVMNLISSVVWTLVAIGFVFLIPRFLHILLEDAPALVIAFIIFFIIFLAIGVYLWIKTINQLKYPDIVDLNLDAQYTEVKCPYCEKRYFDGTLKKCPGCKNEL